MPAVAGDDSGIFPSFEVPTLRKNAKDGAPSETLVNVRLRFLCLRADLVLTREDRLPESCPQWFCRALLLFLVPLGPAGLVAASVALRLWDLRADASP